MCEAPVAVLRLVCDPAALQSNQDTANLRAVSSFVAVPALCADKSSHRLDVTNRLRRQESPESHSGIL